MGRFESILFGLGVVVSLFAGVIGCSKTTIIDMVEEPIPETYTPRTKADTTEVNDSVPITFSVSVEGWNDIVLDTIKID